jgi:hypothetical protein
MTGGNAPQHADSTSSVCELLVGHLQSDFGEGKEQVRKDGFKEMEELHKTEKATSNKLMDMAVSFDNLANSYSKIFRAIKDQLMHLSRKDEIWYMVWLPEGIPDAGSFEHQTMIKPRVQGKDCSTWSTGNITVIQRKTAKQMQC